MKPGDKVQTFQGEIGTIDHAFLPIGTKYQWWVSILINEEDSMLIPYRESELTCVNTETKGTSKVS